MELNVTDHKQIHVLLVEDEFMISEWVAQSLLDQGFAVQTAANAADALDHLVTDEVDVLLTDINLPGGMDGVALAWRAEPLLNQSAPSEQLHTSDTDAVDQSVAAAMKPTDCSGR